MGALGERIRRAIPARFWLFAQFLAFGLLIDPSLSSGFAHTLQVILFALLGAVLVASVVPLLVRLLARVLGIAPCAPLRPAQVVAPPLFAVPCAPGSRGTAQPRAPSGLVRPLG